MNKNLYYVNIPVPERLSQEVKEIEKKWQGSNSASLPHITLVIPRLLMFGRTEAELIDALVHSFSDVKAFLIQMDGIGQFNRKRVIYIKINTTSELLQCHGITNQSANGILEPKEGKGPYKPHITLGKGLSSEIGIEAWRELSQTNWTGSFACQDIQLLRMKPNENKWSVIKAFELKH